MMETWFDFDQVSIDFLFESRLPGSQIWIFPIKDEIIPLVLKADFQVARLPSSFKFL
jgi:hypothetical protein